MVMVTLFFNFGFICAGYQRFPIESWNNHGTHIIDSGVSSEHGNTEVTYRSEAASEAFALLVTSRQSRCSMFRTESI